MILTVGNVRSLSRKIHIFIFIKSQMKPKHIANVQYASTSVQIPRSQRLTRDIDCYLKAFQDGPQGTFQMKFPAGMHKKSPAVVDARLTRLLEGLIDHAKLGETIRIEYTIEGRSEPYYQVVSRNTVAKLQDWLKIMDRASFDSADFFEAGIRAIRGLTVRRGPVVPIEEDQHLIHRVQRVRSGHWYPFYLHDDVPLDLSEFLVFKKSQLLGLDDKIDHCLVNCLEYFKVDPMIVDALKGMVKDYLPQKYLRKISEMFGLAFEVR